MGKTVTAEDLKYGLSILARILDTQGDAVWPLFDRLESELANMQSRRARVQKHLYENLSANAKDREENKNTSQKANLEGV